MDHGWIKELCHIMRTKLKGLHRGTVSYLELVMSPAYSENELNFNLQAFCKNLTPATYCWNYHKCYFLRM